MSPSPTGDGSSRGAGERRTPGVNYRSAERTPVCIPAELLSWESTNRNCVITDFSRNGMGVELVRRASSDPGLIRWLARGVCVSIGFMLPGSGRRVRANADVMHVETEGQRIRFGLHFPVPSAAVMEAVLQGDDRAHSPTLASASDTGGGGALPPWSTVLGQLRDRFIVEARERLTEYSVKVPEDADAFRGLVVFHNAEHVLRDLFDASPSPSPQALKDALNTVLKELAVVEHVRDLLRKTFDELLERYPPPRGPAH